MVLNISFFCLVIVFYLRIDYFESFFDEAQIKLATKDLNFDYTSVFISIKNSVLVLLLIILIKCLIEIYSIKKHFIYPISLIKSNLEVEDKKSIKLLKQCSKEFSDIGYLLQNNSNQKFELLNAKSNAEESERLKSIFLENLSHEIRTPMNAIIGFTDLMLTTEIDENEKKEYLSIIHKSGINLVSIIEDLIELSKIDTNQVTPNYTDVDLDKCLQELHTTINVNIDKTKNIDFYIKESNTRLFYNVKVDQVKLKQVLTNLINNSLKYTEKGHVYFGYEIIEQSELAFIEFTVKDTGIGVSKEHQKVIFDRFKRVESDLAIEKGGLGLGLAISKAYVEMMGGSITIQSIEGEGTSVSFRIPLKFDKKEKANFNLDTKCLAGTEPVSKTILIAEDDNINFLLIKKMLQVTEYEIIRAENGKIAVDIMNHNPHIHLILMDIKMPIMNGYEAFEEIRPLFPNLPIIAQTAHASEEDKNKALSAGFTDYITKPINKEALLEMVLKYSNV